MSDVQDVFIAERERRGLLGERVGYLSGCFDFFHIGHLNVICRAKALCDYLIVGVHKDGSHKGVELVLSLEDRIQVVKSLREVDEVIVSCGNDAAHWDELHYTHLFAGSDYEGSERFKHFEEVLGPKGVKIIFLPYTQGINSTMLREAHKKDGIGGHS